MDVAITVRTRANCLGSRVGAVLVYDNRIVSTGYNGTPAGFPNCFDGGCVRCQARYAKKEKELSKALMPQLANGAKHLDLCICVHAEANVLLSGARFGNRTEGATLYSTKKPCFSCLKEAIQAGVARVVYLEDWEDSAEPALSIQYERLAEHLRQNDARNFERLERQRKVVGDPKSDLRDPILDGLIEKETKKANGAGGPKAAANAGNKKATGAAKKPAAKRATKRGVSERSSAR
jgi:dCMP deaminase